MNKNRLKLTFSILEFCLQKEAWRPFAHNSLQIFFEIISNDSFTSKSYLFILDFGGNSFNTFRVNRKLKTRFSIVAPPAG